MSQISSFYGLETALRGLRAQQRAIDVSGHNIANASTAGYSRQEALLTAADAQHLNAGGRSAQLGAGVQVDQYRRIRDGFLDLQYRSQATRLGEHEGRTEGLDRAELSLAEPGENGIATQLARLWNGWADVVNSPEDPSARQALVEQAASLAGAFQTVDSQLAIVQGQAAEEFDTLTRAGGEIDNIAREIGALNETIGRLTAAGDSPNDLLDRRDSLVDKLSRLGTTTVEALDGGQIRVSFGGATNPIVDGAAVDWPQALTDPAGRLGALLDLSSATGVIATYRTDLSAVAKRLADDINALHRTGHAGTGKDFFAYDPLNPAGTLKVNVTAAEVQTTTAAPGTANGDNSLALKIAGLRGTQPDKDYRAFVSRVGSEVRESKRQEANAGVLVAAVEDRRQSTSGVALDEEMTNLVRFQRAYQASARTLSTMDEMLDVLINRTGRVGL